MSKDSNNDRLILDLIKLLGSKTQAEISRISDLVDHDPLTMAKICTGFAVEMAGNIFGEIVTLATDDPREQRRSIESMIDGIRVCVDRKIAAMPRLQAEQRAAMGDL